MLFAACASYAFIIGGQAVVTYYKNINNKITGVENYEVGCWINCIAPDDEEIEKLIMDFDVDPDFLRAALDEEESSHIDYENGNTLIIIDIPVVTKNEKSITYHTMPLGIIITKTNVITLCLRDNTIIGEFSEGAVRNVFPNLRTQFVLHIILRVAMKYLQYLKQIDKISDHVEKELRKSMKNKELIQLLEIEKSLVYFSSSLKANESTLEKIMRGRRIKLYEEDQELLDDVLIEIKQAIEMSNIHMNILAGTMDVFASIISNNLNIVMKVLASITLLLSIPTIISGIYGMNFSYLLPFATNPADGWIIIAFTVGLMLIAAILLKKKNML